jgi:2-hydroxychromene-2-carboxylate isomerase
MSVNQRRLQFWFEFGSNYSYLSAMRIEEAARGAQVTIEWKPFLLGPIFRELGWENSPFVVQAAKGNYVWRDMEREARKYRLPFNKPSVFPRVSLLPMRVAMLGSDQPWIGQFCRAVMRQNWVDYLDINHPLHVRQALSGLVADPDEVMRQAQDAANKLRLREQTAEARERGIFGAPTFLVGDEMFWGNDRLDDALGYAVARGLGIR